MVIRDRLKPTVFPHSIPFILMHATHSYYAYAIELDHSSRVYPNNNFNLISKKYPFSSIDDYA